MFRAIELHRTSGAHRLLGVAALSCVLCAGAYGQDRQSEPGIAGSPTPTADKQQKTGPSVSLATVGVPLQDQPKIDGRTRRQAERAYLAGAKALERDNLDAAEDQFQRALKLDPRNRSYAVAISVVRQHRLGDIVHQVTEARQQGNEVRAQDLLAKAREIDPSNPLVLEHLEPVVGALNSSKFAQTNKQTRFRQDRPWYIEAPPLAGPIRLASSDAVKDFSIRASAPDVLRTVAEAYGIKAVIDDSVETKALRFEIQNVTYAQAMAALMDMANVFVVPVDETTVLIAKDDTANRQRLEPQLQETIQVPGSTVEQLNELANVIRNIFDVKQTTVQAGSGTIVVRAPESVLEPLNSIVEGLLGPSGEVMLEVRVYEINSTKTVDVGTTLPTQFSVFNVDQAANQIVSQNQTLVQQAIAQGYISPNASNLQIALALIGSGLVQSNLASNLIGVFGGGTLKTGVTANTATTFKFARNSTDTRALDDVQLRIGDGQEATFREGSRYPITTSTYTTGLASSTSSSLNNATINGVNLSSLLSQYAAGTSLTIPQVTYEDLGITLNAKPKIQRTGRINLALDMKIQALTGTSSDGIPLLGNREFKSALSLMDGESALMVSDVSKTEMTALTGIPGLSELPGFQIPTERSTERDAGQIVVIVTPHIVRKRAAGIAGPRIALHTAPGS